MLSLFREIPDVECGEQKFEFELKYNLGYKLRQMGDRGVTEIVPKNQGINSCSGIFGLELETTIT